MIRSSFLATAVMMCASASGAATLTHSANDFAGAVTPAFGTLADTLGSAFISAGVDYTYGNIEGVYNDGGPLSICGINGNGVCDLLTDVDGQIVAPNTLTQAFTNYIWAEAGFAGDRTLLLSVFNGVGELIESVYNSTAVVGPNGRSTFSIDRGAVYDIAFFSISGDDTYGVNTVEIGTPIAAVPLPATLPLIAGGLFALGAVSRRRRSA